MRWRGQVCRMKGKSLHLVTSGSQPLSEVKNIVQSAYRGGVDYLHIREKQLTASQLIAWVEQLSAVFPRERILVNDRVDVAAASGCKGAHLAYHSLPPALAKQILGKHQWAGRSVHSLQEAEEANLQGADYLFYGHIYASGSKPGLPPRGTAELAQIAASVTIPVIAIGGIVPELVPEVMAAGCAGIALLSGITAARDPEASARAYRKALDESGGEK